MVRVEDRSDVAAGVLQITLDRPDRRNAVAHATLLELLDAQTHAAEARVVVLTGAPPAFCAGADLHGVEAGVFAADLDRVLRGFTQLAAPVIAAVDGPALGAGSQLVAVCDLRVATPASVFGIPAARLGLVIDGWTLDRVVAEFTAPVARAMLLAAETYTGDELHRIGAVHRLGDLEVALAWAGAIAKLAPLSIRGHKLGLERDDRFGDARARAWASDDAREGREAFLAKRNAEFRGR